MSVGVGSNRNAFIQNNRRENGVAGREKATKGRRGCLKKRLGRRVLVVLVWRLNCLLN